MIFFKNQKSNGRSHNLSLPRPLFLLKQKLTVLVPSGPKTNHVGFLGILGIQRGVEMDQHINTDPTAPHTTSTTTATGAAAALAQAGGFGWAWCWARQPRASSRWLLGVVVVGVMMERLLLTQRETPSGLAIESIRGNRSLRFGI